MTTAEYRQCINNVIIMLSEELIRTEGDEEVENLKAIDALAAKLEAGGMSRSEAYAKAGETILTPVEVAKRRAERGI